MKTKLKKGLVLVMLCALVLGMGIDSSAAEVTTDLEEMFTLVNHFRQSSDAWFYSPDGTKMNCTGLSVLNYNELIQSLAMKRAQELADAHAAVGRTTTNWDWLSHTSPSGSNDGYGENIAYGGGSLGSAAAIFAGWQETNEAFSGQGHRRNMLGIIYNDSVEKFTYTNIGIGHVEEEGHHYWVQLFDGAATWNPDQHITPEKPTVPEDPIDPEEPIGPEDPADPDKPQKPEDPTDPEEPAGPEDPADPDKPQEPEDPADPEKPVGPDKPEPPSKPEQPDDPDQPGKPDTPNKPADPGTATKPGTSGSTGSSKKDTPVNVKYNVVSGAGSAWTKGSGKPLVITTDGDFKKFFSVAIDGAVIDKSNYSVSSGSTVVSLNAAFLETLSVGEHRYLVYYTDGEVETTFRIDAAQTSVSANASNTNTAAGSSNAAGSKAPQTGDSTTVAMAVFMMMISAAGITLSLKARKRF